MKKRHAVLTRTFTNVLDTSGMLSSKSPSRAYCEPLKRVARWVAIALVGAMSIGASPLESAQRNAFTSKDYIRSLLNNEQALCLIKLYGKESAFKTDAIGNLNGSQQTYGIPQLKNPMIKDMNAYNQIDYGMKYIEHRYGSPCKAYAHWVRKGWH